MFPIERILSQWLWGIITGEAVSALLEIQTLACEPRQTCKF